MRWLHVQLTYPHVWPLDSATLRPRFLGLRDRLAHLLVRVATHVGTVQQEDSAAEEAGTAAPAMTLSARQEYAAVLRELGVAPPPAAPVLAPSPLATPPLVLPAAR